eukprot:TRINITY_DN9604_c0_g1_i8.p1 TRINITY_DN9604_c0_g1~~TRINITY_DN9604_c0_g1_i8.p1  ORF type:complete len:135 (+),score=34.28 TRINITY_DN9604_c0_g1_i8:138-542(+)
MCIRDSYYTSINIDMYNYSYIGNKGYIIIIIINPSHMRFLSRRHFNCRGRWWEHLLQILLLVHDAEHKGAARAVRSFLPGGQLFLRNAEEIATRTHIRCLLYTSDAADEEDSVDLGGRRIIKKKKKKKKEKIKR